MKSILSILLGLTLTIGLSKTPLNLTDQESLLYMLEEEKLALDVYTYLGNLYNQNPFNNIKNSEQSHMNTVADILTENGTAYTIMPSGVFNNPTLQSLYNQLIAQGEISLVEALKVGMTIEDVDIYDLEDLKTQTQNTTIIALYDWLICGSKNHMRAFKNKLYMNGGTYTPQYITVELYNTIISGSNSECTLLSNETFDMSQLISNTIVTSTFQILLDGKSTVEIYNMQGKLLKRILVIANENVDISHFSNGTYLAKIENNNKFKSIKIIKK